MDKDRQAAYDLFTDFLRGRQSRGIDLQKELPGLLAYGCAQEFFRSPYTVHELSEWPMFGDKLWRAIIDEDKTARELGNLWRVVHAEFLKYQAEERAAQQTSAARESNRRCRDWFGSPPIQTPALKSSSLQLSAAAAGSSPPARIPAVPSAPPAPVLNPAPPPPPPAPDPHPQPPCRSAQPAAAPPERLVPAPALGDSAAAARLPPAPQPPAPLRSRPAPEPRGGGRTGLPPPVEQRAPVSPPAPRLPAAITTSAKPAFSPQPPGASE